MMRPVELLDQDPRRDDWWSDTFALRDAWHAVEHGRKVGSRPIRHIVHQQPYFLFRRDGRIQATERHPSEMNGAGPFSDLTGGAGRYPVVERYGLVWVWFGDPAHAHPDLVPDVPYLAPEGGMPWYAWGTCTFDCTYELACENSMDSTHAEFLHFGVVGRIEADVDGITVHSDSEKVIVTREAKNRIVPRGAKPVRLLPADAHDAEFVNIIHLRNGVLEIRSRLDPPGMTDYVFIAYVPESRYRTRMNYVQYQVGGPKQSALLSMLAKPLGIVAGAVLPGVLSIEDNLAFTQQQHNYIDRPSARSDANSRFDLGGLTYRKRMRELIARQRDGDFSYRSDATPSLDLSVALRMPEEDLRSGPRLTSIRAAA